MLVKFIPGFGYVESFEDFVDCCYQVGRIKRQTLDQTVMEILGAYYPAFHKSIIDTHSGLPVYPGKTAAYGKQASFTSLDKYVLPYLDEHWSD